MPTAVGGASSAAFPEQAPVDRSAFGLSIQRDQVNVKAQGSALGQGQRVAPQPSALFSQPPMSGGQFGSGHAKSIATFGGQPMIGGGA